MKNYSLYPGFINWTERFEFYRIGMMAAMLLLQGCIMVPLCVYSIHMAGIDHFQLNLVIGLAFMILVCNLTIQPTRIVVPIFMLVILLQPLIIGFNLYQYSVG